MKEIKLTGREAAVLRAIDYTSGTTGAGIAERTQIEGEDVADILNAMCDIGYVESVPPIPVIDASNYAATLFEVNPSYALQLREALRRR
jgi:hypothetical protein